VSGTACILSVSNLRVMLDPQTYDTCHTREYWLQCGRAAMAALRSCCLLSPEEISFLHRDRFMPDGQAIVCVRDTFEARNRDIPLIEAARLVVIRYIEATPEKFKSSRYLFVTPKSARLNRSTVKLSLNRAARRKGICDNFMEASAATFVNAVYHDPVDDGAALLLTGRSLADAGFTVPPTTQRLRNCLEQYHPLRDLNSIGFFEAEQRLSNLAADIRACKEPRRLQHSDRQLLRRQHLPEAVKLFDEGVVTQVAIGRYFGLDRHQVYMWFKRYRRKGREGLIDRKRGRLTPEWRRKTMELYEKMSPIKSRHAFFKQLKKRKFPYGYTTLNKFLNEAGERSPKKEVMTEKWRDLVDREFAKFERPPQKRELLSYLQEEFEFPYDRKTLEKYLDRAGLSPIRRGSIRGNRDKATEVRPEC
jgi:transposase